MGTSNVIVKDKLTNKQVVVEVQVVETVNPNLGTHFGKYVNYVPDDAIWANSKLPSYGVFEIEEKTDMKFNIYDYTTSASANGKVKSQSITCYSRSYPNKYNGWRVLDVSSSGQITLIHAGTPECYYHDNYGDASDSGRLLRYVSTPSSLGTSKAWSKYGNTTIAESVHYMDEPDWETLTTNMATKKTLSNCYDERSTVACGKGNSMVDIGSYYWMALGISGTFLYNWDSNYQFVSNWKYNSLGVRPVVVLNSEVKFANDGKTGSSESEALNLVVP